MTIDEISRYLIKYIEAFIRKSKKAYHKQIVCLKIGFCIKEFPLD